MLKRLAARLPFYYGWVIVAVVFVTMGLAVNARTAFSLVLPPVLKEYGWDRGLTAGAFSFGFLVSALLSPVLGRLMDRHGPRLVNGLGVVATVAGLMLAPLVSQPWHLYLTLGVLVGTGSVCLGFSGQNLYLPHWFARKRGFASSIAFAGVGIGSIILLPWMQHLIVEHGWRAACWTLGLVTLICVGPLVTLVRRTPQEIGLMPDGDTAPPAGAAARRSNVLDARWAARTWTLSAAMRTTRFWWIALGYFCGLYTWYTVQVHQTQYLVEVGFSATTAAWALGAVSLIGVPGQIVLGALSDRIGREWVWTIGSAGFLITYAALLGLKLSPTDPLMYLMVIAQGLLGYGVTSVFGAIVLEIFEGPHYGSIFGTLMLVAIAGGAAGPWLTGVIHDRTGSYDQAFVIAIAVGIVSILAIWRAAPGKVRAVAARMRGP